MFDGGGAATRGFVIQAMVALLDSLDRDDWSTVTVEPHLPTEKVDIQWRRAGTERHAQVKHRSGGVEVGHARRWAKALKTESPAAECVLHIVGPVSRGVVALDGVLDGVRVEVCGHDLASIRARCRASLHAVLDARGLHGRSNATHERGVDRLAGILVVKSADGHGWTPATLWSEVQNAVAPEPGGPNVPDGVRWSQTRIIEIEASGDCVETHITSYVNSGRNEVGPLGALVRVTDSESTTEQVWDNDGEPEWKGGLIGVAHTILVSPRGVLLPGAARHVGVRVRRRGCAEIDGTTLSYSDTALPPEVGTPACQVCTWVLLPERWHGAVVQAPRAEVIRPGAIGFLFAANGHRKFSIRAGIGAARPNECAEAAQLRNLTRPPWVGDTLRALRREATLARLLGDLLL